MAPLEANNTATQSSSANNTEPASNGGLNSNNTNSTTNTTSSERKETHINSPKYGDSSKANSASSHATSYITPSTEKPTISLITGVSPIDKLTNSLASNPSSDIPPASSAYSGNSLPSFHHHHTTPLFHHRNGQSSQPLNSPFPSPELLNSRGDDYLHRPFANYPPPSVVPQGSSAPFSDSSELDDDARSRKRYGRPPGAKDKRPRRRRTKAQMEEDALIYGYRDSESVYHSPNSLSKRRRLSPRRNSIDDSPGDEANSPPQSSYSYPAYNNYSGSLHQNNHSPTNNFNPFLHRHHLPGGSSSNPSTALPSLRNTEHMANTHSNSGSPWLPRSAESERIPGSQIPDSRAGVGDFGSSRYPPSPIGPTGFSSINAGRPSENYRPSGGPYDDRMERRGREPSSRYSPPPPLEYRRDRDKKWESPASPPANTLPRLGELSRLSDLPLERPRWDRHDDVPRKSEYDHRGGGGANESKFRSIALSPTIQTMNGVNQGDAHRRTDHSILSRPAGLEMLASGSEGPLIGKGSQDRLAFRDRSGSITNLIVGPPLEADTARRDEEDTDEQIEEYRSRMLEQHSSYYNASSGKPRVKREPSYAIPKVPLQEENERLRAALQRYRQQKGIERLKLEEFINKRCNGDQTMIKELLTITGHIAEDDYIGPVKPACL